MLGPFKTIRDAAVTALRSIADKSQDKQIEFGGFIVSRDKQYFATDPVTSNDPTGVTLTEALKETRSRKEIVSAYHTHPTTPGSFRDFSFSETDLIAARAGGFKAWYMAAPKFNEVYEGRRDIPFEDVLNPVDGSYMGLGMVGEPIAKIKV